MPLSTNFPFLLAETIDENSDATNAKCKTIKLPMTVSKMDGFSYYNFSVWPLKRNIIGIQVWWLCNNVFHIFSVCDVRFDGARRRTVQFIFPFVSQLSAKLVSSQLQGEFFIALWICVGCEWHFKCFLLQINIEEANKSNFLSAGEMPLPSLYFMMSLIFFLSGLFWLFLLKKSS